MEVTFNVSNQPVLQVTTDKPMTQIVAVNQIVPLLAKIVFPKVNGQPTLTDLVQLLSSYADNLPPNADLATIAAATEGVIPYVEFRQNLSIELSEP